MNNVKNFRVKFGLTQTELAKKIGVSRTTIANIELGVNNSMSKEVLDSLCSLFQVSPVVLYGFDNFKNLPSTVEDLNWLIDQLVKEKEKWESEKN